MQDMRTFPRTAQQRAVTATNDFICDFVELHGESQATRDEAHDIVAHLEGLAEDVRKLTDKYVGPLAEREIAAENILDQLASGYEQQCLAAWLYAALVEKAKEAEAIQPILIEGA